MNIYSLIFNKNAPIEREKPLHLPDINSEAHKMLYTVFPAKSALILILTILHTF